jgi:hypothetical protein
LGKNTRCYPNTKAKKGCAQVIEHLPRESTGHHVQTLVSQKTQKKNWVPGLSSQQLNAKLKNTKEKYTEIFSTKK